MSDDREPLATTDEPDSLHETQLEQVSGGTVTRYPELEPPGAPPPFIDPSTYGF